MPPLWNRRDFLSPCFRCALRSVLGRGCGFPVDRLPEWGQSWGGMPWQLLRGVVSAFRDRPLLAAAVPSAGVKVLWVQRPREPRRVLLPACVRPVRPTPWPVMGWGGSPGAGVGACPSHPPISSHPESLTGQKRGQHWEGDPSSTRMPSVLVASCYPV